MDEDLMAGVKSLELKVLSHLPGYLWVHPLQVGLGHLVVQRRRGDLCPLSHPRLLSHPVKQNK